MGKRENDVNVSLRRERDREIGREMKDVYMKGERKQKETKMRKEERDDNQNKQTNCETKPTYELDVRGAVFEKGSKVLLLSCVFFFLVSLKGDDLYHSGSDELDFA